jgi:hypothetical protein
MVLREMAAIANAGRPQKLTGSANDIVFKHLAESGYPGSLPDKLAGYASDFGVTRNTLLESRYITTFDETAMTYIQLGSKQTLNFINGFEIRMDVEYTQTVTASARYIGDRDALTFTDVSVCA